MHVCDMCMWCIWHDICMNGMGDFYVHAICICDLCVGIHKSDEVAGGAVVNALGS